MPVLRLATATATRTYTSITTSRIAATTASAATFRFFAPTSRTAARISAASTARTFCATALAHAKSHRINKMPPKKQAVVEKIRLGRPSNNLKMGIVGLPNVGKSSLFNVIAKCDLGKSANFPYATIEPEEARVPVPDERFTWLAGQYKPKSEVPAFLTCIDIAGLTAGASTGAGLGNAFLSNVRSVDGIFQVVRAFDDAEVIHVEGDVNPIRDMEIISTELRLKDIDWIEKALDNSKKNARSAGNVSLEDKKRKEEVAIIEKILKHVQEDNKDIRKGDWSNNEVRILFGNAVVGVVQMMIKSAQLETLDNSLTQLVDGPSSQYEIISFSTDPHRPTQQQPLPSLHNISLTLFWHWVDL